MPLPRSIRVGPFTWTVSYDPFLMDAVGETKAEQLTIRLKPGHAPDYERDTLVHELIHACLVHSPLELDHDLEEKICLALAPALLDTLRRNPKLAAYLLEK